MGRSRPVEHDEIVRRFAVRLREVRRSRGLTQAELADRATVTPSYMTRLENATVAPGIDLVARLATALGTTPADLLPTDSPPDPSQVLRDEARRLIDQLLPNADRDTLALLVPLLARLADAPATSR